ncbi:right-handed parallel beta-helix repeat-containing protein [Paenibacillus soyae]|uniref:Right-handed parallel beta-helix repeat-containing protein n=1 Tax=Paenibacillus soyae TaxID=2969249 RepID=A0A9X2MV24_9BACL|nr:right-handed parallel beta-helix repeat-containing protein [Paenibacillus soyae]MCR2807399.1 right-handed parallel beta-helix repeat-containing protein [Paenibacillus soyae]
MKKLIQVLCVAIMVMSIGTVGWVNAAHAASGSVVINLVDYKSHVKDLGTANEDWAPAIKKAQSVPHTIIQFPAGVIRVSEVSFKSKETWIGNQTKLLLKPKAMITMYKVHDVVLDGFEVDGNNFLNEKVGINVTASKNVTIMNSYFHHIANNAINVDSDNGSENVTVQNCKFDNIGNDRVNPTYQGNAVYLKNVVGAKVVGSTFEKIRGHAAITFIKSKNVLIDGNNIRNTFYRGIEGYSSNRSNVNKGITISNNVLNDIGGISTEAGANSAVARNGIFVQNPYGTAEDILVTNNKITNTVENGIEGKGTFVGNTIENTFYKKDLDTPSKEGIYLTAGSIARNNTIINAGSDGILSFGNPSQLTITGNTIISPARYGIRIQADGQVASKITIEDNSIALKDNAADSNNRIRLIASNGGRFVQESVSMKNNK